MTIMTDSPVQPFLGIVDNTVDLPAKFSKSRVLGHSSKVQTNYYYSWRYQNCRKFGGEVVHVGILALQAKGISCFGWEVRQKLRVLEYL